MSKRNSKSRRRRNTQPHFPKRVFVKADDREEYDYEALLAKCPFAEADATHLEHLAGRASLKPQKRSLQLRKPTGPFDKLGTTKLEVSHEK